MTSGNIRYTVVITGATDGDLHDFPLCCTFLVHHFLLRARKNVGGGPHLLPTSSVQPWSSVWSALSKKKAGDDYTLTSGVRWQKFKQPENSKSSFRFRRIDNFCLDCSFELPSSMLEKRRCSTNMQFQILTISHSYLSETQLEKHPRGQALIRLGEKCLEFRSRCFADFNNLTTLVYLLGKLLSTPKMQFNEKLPKTKY